MKTKIIIPILTLVLLTSYGCKKINLEHEEAMNLEIMDIGFSTLIPGGYTGYYYGGMCGWRENECKVTVDRTGEDYSSVITIELVKSVEDRPQSFFDELYRRVIDKQSLQVDVISGATLTSKAHLKAVEDALVKATPENIE